MTPSLAAARGMIRRLAPAERAPLALYGVYTAVLFLLFLVATFPHELVVRRVLERTAGTPVAIEVRSVRLGWTLAYMLDEVRLLQRGGDAALPLLAATSVRAAPSLLGLLSGHPYPLGIRADLYGGTVAATVDPRPAAFYVRAGLADIDVGRYAGLRLFMEGTLRGRLAGTVELTGDAQKPATTNGRLEIRAAGLAIEGGKIRGITVPDLHFPELRLAGTIKNGRLELSELVATGSEVNVRGEGNVLLQQPLEASLMNLALTLRPALEIPDSLRLALNLIPGDVGAGGERTLGLYGSFAQPRLRSPGRAAAP